MLRPGSFEEKDKERLVEFLNFVAKNAKFEMQVPDIIKFYGLLNWAQQALLKKVNDNILEVKAIHEPEPKPEPRKARGRKAASK